VKVIKKEDTSNWAHRFKCYNCETELEAEAKDLRVKYVPNGTDMRGLDADSKRTEFYVTCTECHRDHTVDDKNIPKLLQHKVKESSSGSRDSYPPR
jgi:hypothetical protein